MIILTILFTFTLVKIFCQYTENCWENRPNVQGKDNSSVQYAVKIVPRRTAPRICARAIIPILTKYCGNQRRCYEIFEKCISVSNPKTELPVFET